VASHGGRIVWAVNAVAQVLSVLVGITLIAVGVLETFFYRNQRFHSIFLISPADYDAVRLWVRNVGVYNMLMGLACLLGVLIVNVGDDTVGRTLILAVCAMHVVLGVTLYLTERRLGVSALGEALPPLAVIILTVAWG
jgi:putative membrane protein